MERRRRYLIDKVNCWNAMRAQDILASLEQRNWALCHAYDLINQDQKIAEEARYVLFKHKNIFPFYTNALGNPHSFEVNLAFEHAIKCVPSLKQWFSKNYY